MGKSETKYRIFAEDKSQVERYKKIKTVGVKESSQSGRELWKPFFKPFTSFPVV